MEPVTIAEAMERVQEELDRIGARNPIMSTNVETRLDGRPRSDRREPEDPAVALYFELRGKPHCLPCDTYTKVAQNIAAIAAHLAASRAIERHGVATIEEMFTGFLALPAPGKAESALWWNVLRIDRNASEDDIRAAYRRRAAEVHPDQPEGSQAAMAEVNLARDAALKEVKARA